MTDTTRRSREDSLFLHEGLFNLEDEPPAEDILTGSSTVTSKLPAQGTQPSPREPADDQDLGPRTVELGGRKYNFRQLPDHVLWHPDLQPSEIVFYTKIMYLCAAKGYCTYSVPFMAAACKVTDRAIQNWEKHLIELGLLIRKQRKHADDPNRNDNNVLTVVEEPEQEPSHAFRHADVVESVKAELVRRREEKAAKAKEKAEAAKSGTAKPKRAPRTPKK